MTVQTTILLVLVGLAAGILSGLVGVGGGNHRSACMVFVLAKVKSSARNFPCAALFYNKPKNHRSLKPLADPIIEAKDDPSP